MDKNWSSIIVDLHSAINIMPLSSSSSWLLLFSVCICVFLTLLFFGHGGVEAATHNQPYRTGYHFQPPKNPMNDPNGPMVYKGLYHLFYQWKPNGTTGSKVWAHSTSTDLVNWVSQKIAIYPSQKSDLYGCWSGSTTILPDGKPAILYTGLFNPQKEQVQNLAVPKDLSDPYLVEWVKSPLNPLMAPTPTNHINASSFRDPTTAWLGPDGRWRVIIGSKRGKRGMAILYKSKDFIHWTMSQHPLYSAANTGMWECPDFFPVSTFAPEGLDTSVNGPHVKHVFKCSLDDTKKDHYTIGTYNVIKDAYTPDKGSILGDPGLRYDYGKFYASKTFFDSIQNRRILWGWINESSTAEDDAKKGWSGLQAVPRAIWLDKSGKQLVQWPVIELEKLRTGRVDLSNKLLKGGSKIEVFGVTASQADVEVSFDLPNLDKADVFDPSWPNPSDLCTQKGASVQGGVGPFGLKVLASKGLEEYTAVFFKIFKGHNNKYILLMCSDQSSSSLNDSNDKATYGAFLNVDLALEKLTLRTLIDHSIVESFGRKGKVCITARVYPTKAIGDGAHLYAFNNGKADAVISSLSAWSMKKANIN